MKTSEFQWLYDLLVCFNKGDLHQYEELCMRHAVKLNAQPALVENERKLREKITILCLLELIARLGLLVISPDFHALLSLLPLAFSAV